MTQILLHVERLKGSSELAMNEEQQGCHPLQHKDRQQIAPKAQTVSLQQPLLGPVNR